MEAWGSYELTAYVGSGESADLFEARRFGLPAHSRVMLKVLKQELAADRDSKRRFEMDARIGRLVRHDNLVRAVDAGDENGVPYIAMEFLVGCNLRAIMPRGRALDMGYAGAVGIAIAEALHQLHTAVDEAGDPMHVLHLAVAPEHVFLGSDGRIKLLRYGTDGEDRRSSPAGLTGDANYAAPEHFVAGAIPGPSADVFSLGSLLMELVTGEPLMWSGTPSMLTGPMNDLRRLLTQRNVPRSLQEILLRAIAYRPADRYRTARELADSLGVFHLTMAGSNPVLAAAEVPLVELLPDETRAGSIDLRLAKPSRSKLWWLAPLIFAAATAAGYAFFR